MNSNIESMRAQLDMSPNNYQHGFRGGEVTEVTKEDIMSNAEAEAVVIAEVEGVMLEGPNPLAGEIIASPMATVHTPVPSATLLVIHTT